MREDNFEQGELQSNMDCVPAPVVPNLPLLRHLRHPARRMVPAVEDQPLRGFLGPPRALWVRKTAWRETLRLKRALERLTRLAATRRAIARIIGKPREDFLGLRTGCPGH